MCSCGIFFCGREYVAFVGILKGFLIEKTLRISYRKELWIGKLGRLILSLICWETSGESKLTYLNIFHSISCLKYRNEGD